MGIKLEYIEGQTRIDEDEKEGLRIKTISTRSELDEFEQANIQQAIEWSIKSKFKRDDILSEEFILLVHKKMFDEVWSWAGTKRKTDKNIGVDKHYISIELKKLLDDCNYWMDQNIYEPDEFAIRFSHRLVKIHVFPNGNGRHSRLFADIMITNLFNKPFFSWGGADLTKSSNLRKEYLLAIYKADEGFIQPLIDFSRS